MLNLFTLRNLWEINIIHYINKLLLEWAIMLWLNEIQIHYYTTLQCYIIIHLGFNIMNNTAEIHAEIDNGLSRWDSWTKWEYPFFRSKIRRNVIKGIIVSTYCTHYHAGPYCSINRRYAPESYTHLTPS